MVRLAKLVVGNAALVRPISAEAVYSVVVLGSALVLIGQDRVHPVLMYCLQLFLAV